MTHASLVPYLVEETYELVEAIEAGSREALLEELGDVLWQVAFHSAIAARERGEDFDIHLVAQRLIEKMVRRHPHVFGEERAETLEDVARLWSAAKADEKSERTSVLEGIPLAMPALARAQKVLGRASRIGIDVSPAALPADEVELGRELLALADAARVRGLDAEAALRGAVRELETCVRDAEHG